MHSEQISREIRKITPNFVEEITVIARLSFLFRVMKIKESGCVRLRIFREIRCPRGFPVQPGNGDDWIDRVRCETSADLGVCGVAVFWWARVQVFSGGIKPVFDPPVYVSRCGRRSPRRVSNCFDFHRLKDVVQCLAENVEKCEGGEVGVAVLATGIGECCDEAWVSVGGIEIVETRNRVYGARP